jgi:uncharacterized Zn finger protein
MPDIEQLFARCPGCSPGQDVPVELVHHRRVRCRECGIYFDLPPEKSPVSVGLRVSRHGSTESERVELRGDETLYVGDERVFEIGYGAVGIEITALELAGGKRVESSDALNLECIWGRAVDEVTVRVTVQRGSRSTSRQIKVHGLYEFTVGEIERISGVIFRIKTIRTRHGQTLKRSGDSASAKDIRTIYAEEPMKSRGSGTRTHHGRERTAGSSRGLGGRVDDRRTSLWDAGKRRR